jgi:aerobic-type carbon monoxide dehydrogenase small subunit (CoxS/CutS family)
MPLYTLRVNGRTHRVQAEPDDSLLSILRNDLELTGSKYGCGEGQCGACTVLLDGHTTRSCVTAVSRVGASAVTTIEGLADSLPRSAGAAEAAERLHPVQQAFLDAEAFQCGYCTPGMVMAVVGLLATHPNPTDDEIARVMDRNVCRCGTFPRIVQAIKLAAARLQATPGGRR